MPPRSHPEAPKELDRYLIPSERIVFDLRRNKIVLAGPFFAMIGGWVLAIWLLSHVGDSAGLRNVLLIVAAAGTLWFVIALVEWWKEIFLATDRRLMLVHGIVTRQVDIMPMSKVTDMRYDRSVGGYIFGYGTYVLESAGQDQALSTIKYVPDPDLHYRQISDVLFAPPGKRMSEKLVPTASGPQLPVNEAENFWVKKRS